MSTLDDEAKLKNDLVKELRDHMRLRGAVVLRHEDRHTAGIPDISVTLHTRTLWVEVKYADPEFKSPGQQELTMLRLSAAGLAKYVIYEKTEDRTSTRLLHPKNIKDWRSDASALLANGINHRFIAERIASILAL